MRLPTSFALAVLALIPAVFAASPAQPASQARSGKVPEATPVEIARSKAETLEAQGKLAEARDAWHEAAALFEFGHDRDACVAAARRLDARLLLRTEIVAAVPLDQRIFAELGIERADATGLVSAGKRIEWNTVPLDLLERAAAASRASRSAANGVVFEAVARGSDAEKRAALVTAGKRFTEREMDAADAFALVALVRNEAIPAKGYAFRKETWSSVEVLEAKAAASGLEDLGKKLETAQPAQRGALIASLRALGPEAMPRLSRALEVRWINACKALEQGGTISSIEAVAAARRTLDERRKHALELIFDEEKYFYPYNPPECPPDKARLYAGVQQEVNERVSAVREAWKSARKAQVPAPFRAAVLEIAWLRSFARAPENKALPPLAFVLPSTVPPWIEGIDRDADSVDLASFAWDAKERAQLVRDAHVEAFNARAWTMSQTDAASVARSEEQRQVLVTNEYRKMLGRCVLAWNPKIQAAARGHSTYMANTGDFGHFEKDPARKTPGDRLKLAGYTAGGSENCHMGDSGAEGAHTGWTHSSGHHRNILGAGHREMASACESIYWTQNFGGGREFEKDLEQAKKP
jgi:uncharacterized protein YkwD